MYSKDWLSEVLSVTHSMIINRSLYLFLFTNKVANLNHTDNLSSIFQSGFPLRLTPALLTQEFIIAARFFSLSYVLDRMLLLLSAQENENLELTSPFLNPTHSGTAGDTMKHRPIRLAGNTEEWVFYFSP